MPASPVCIGVTYADGKHMRMFALCRCVAYGYAAHILFSHFFTADPKKASYGSPRTAPARSGAETQYVPLRQLMFLLYVVFIPCPVTGRSAPKKGGVVIPCAWYTSGKLRYARKSDLTGTVVR